MTPTTTATAKTSNTIQRGTSKSMNSGLLRSREIGVGPREELNFAVVTVTEVPYWERKNTITYRS